MKFILSYTLKSPAEENRGAQVLEFASREAAEEYAAEKANEIYWHQVTAKEPRSGRPKVPVASGKDLAETHDRIEGTLQTHFETGMECLGLVLYEDGKRGPPNPGFDPEVPEDGNNFRNFSTYEALHYVGKGDVLEYDGARYLMGRDSEFARDDGYRLSVYPVGFSRAELLGLFAPETKRAVLWKRK
jgi:hypothetical protein